LSRLGHEPLVPGVQVLALEEHVDYGERLGWRDPFSSSGFSNRQSEYDGRVFHSGGAYTPQLVIDGRFQAVGSDVNAVRRAVVSAAHGPKASVDVTVHQEDARLARPGRQEISRLSLSSTSGKADGLSAAVAPVSTTGDPLREV
jgi:hypothetical protein